MGRGGGQQGGGEGERGGQVAHGPQLCASAVHPQGRFLLLWGQCLRLVAAEVGDRAAPAFGRTSLADVTAVEDQPVMCADAKRRGHLPFELLLDRKHGLSGRKAGAVADARSEEHTSELQSLMRISYAVF